MLINSKQLPLTKSKLLEVKDFCLNAQARKRLIIDGGVPDSLRRDYLNASLPLPDRAISHITIAPDDWREILIEACARVARVAINNLSIEKIVVHYLWRAGLALLPGFSGLGIKENFHFGLRRNERNPDQTEEVYLPINNSLKSSLIKKHVIADVMLATGGSFDTFIKKLILLGVKTGQVSIVCLIAAPEGIFNLLQEYPDITIFAGQVDERLDGAGYIVPGLGDAGDKLFSKVSLDYFNPVKMLFSEKEWGLLRYKINQANPGNGVS